MAFENNPWSAEFWNLTHQGAYIKQFGEEVAKTKARQAGARFGDLKPRAVNNFAERHWIISKRQTGGGGGGTAGSGPPS